MTIGK